MRTIDKIIDKVNCQYGAPMGRSSYSNCPIREISDNRITLVDKDGNLRNMRLFDCAVPMSNDGYDRGGAYWGIGKQLRVKYTKDLSYIEFYRK